MRWHRLDAPREARRRSGARKSGPRRREVRQDIRGQGDGGQLVDGEEVGRRWTGSAPTRSSSATIQGHGDGGQLVTAKRRLGVDAFVLNNNADETTASPTLDPPPRPRGAHSREKSRRSCAAGEEAVPARQGSGGGAWSTGERRAGAKKGDFPLTH
jgi:hypothetical protein